MNDTVKTLTERLAEKREDGLVDIKFYVRRIPTTSAKSVLAEACAMFAAIEDGAVEPFAFNDRRTAA